MALHKLDSGKILRGGVGSGKTITTLAWYMAQTPPWEHYPDLYIITTAKKRDSLDWEKEALHFGISTDASLSRAGAIKVDSWNNIGKYTEVKNAVFVFDEQRLVGSGTWTKSFITIAKRNKWVLLSATPGDTWLDYIPVFVANGFYKNRTEFKREHVVYNSYSKFPKVDRYIGVGKLLKHRHDIMVEMPYERHTTRKTVIKDMQFDAELLERVEKKRWHVYEGRPLRDVAELFSVMRKVVNSDPSRSSAIRELLTQHPRLIVFYNFNYELEALRTLGEEMSQTLNSSMSGSNAPTKSSSTTTKQRSSGSSSKADSPSLSLLQDDTTERVSTSPDLWNNRMGITSESGDYPQLNNTRSITPSVEEPQSTSTQTTRSSRSFAVAEWNGHKHQQIPTTDSWLYLVQYTAGAEGWNCIETDAIAFYSLNYSYKIFEQAMGRIDRLNTPFETLYYHILKSNTFIDKAIWKALMGKENFQESKYTPRYEEAA
jgi:hypothetical protein